MIGRVIGTKGSMTKFQPTKDFQATMFLKRLLDNPDKLDEVSTGITIQILLLTKHIPCRPLESKSSYCQADLLN